MGREKEKNKVLKIAGNVLFDSGYLLFYSSHKNEVKTKEKYEARITHLKNTTGNKNNSYY